MKKLLPLFLTALAFAANGQTKDLTRWVNPFIGTGGHGHTFPGATMPHGMVQLSPDTRVDNWDGSSGYHYSDDTIRGFSHTHLSGTGIPDYCDILFMPLVGEPYLAAAAGSKEANGYASRFSHATETGSPGYYSVLLEDDGIRAELTSTIRVGLHRYTFPRSGDSYVILDLGWRDKLLDSEVTISGSRVEGFRRSSSWAKDQKIYFVAEFSKAPIAISQGPFGIGRAGENVDVSKAKPTHFGFRFATKEREQILLKVAISSVSIEGARKNLASELPGWDFDKVRADAKAAWNKELSRIEVSGGTDAQTTNFYTALYHTMIHPNVFNDVDGGYRGLDGNVHRLPGYGTNSLAAVSGAAQPPSLRRSTASPQKAERSRGATGPAEQYTVFSLWDTFRAAHPLYTIIDQKRTVDYINTFIRQYEQGGRLPVWELAGNETDCMIGYHSVSVIADAMAKGIEGFDYEKAYAAAKHSAELDHFGLAAYKKRGYVSMEDEQESVSKTLEYAYDDWCIAQMARLMERRHPAGSYAKDRERYSARAAYYENLFDPGTEFFRPKQNGGFVKPFAPNEVTFHYTEGNAWQYSFFVPQDVGRLMELMGGQAGFNKKLDELFTTESKLAGREQPDITGLIGQYAHGNEPSHHIAYLYNYAGQPWKTQKYVRKILDEFYKPTPDGLIGNEDCGQMSAWYVMSASGFYQVAPGDPTYVVGTPLFKEIKYNLENGKTFIVRAPNVSAENIYVQDASTRTISHEQIMKGGVLTLNMGSRPTPEMRVLVKPLDRTGREAAVPIITGGGRSFTERTRVSLASTTSGADILYTLGGEWKVYAGPFDIDQTTTVKALSIAKADREPIGGLLERYAGSKTVEATFVKMPNDWSVKINSRYSRQYTGGGDEGLIDGIRGTVNFASGEWQGYQGQDFVATIDLKKDTLIKELGGGFLQVARSWIWMPTRVDFDVSNDGVTFRKAGSITTDTPVQDMEPKTKDYITSVPPITARYVRVHAYNLGKIPSWHPGAGGDAYIFVDEIFVR